MAYTNLELIFFLGPGIMLGNDRDLQQKIERENAAKPFGDRLAQEEGPGNPN